MLLRGIGADRPAGGIVASGIQLYVTAPGTARLVMVTPLPATTAWSFATHACEGLLLEKPAVVDAPRTAHLPGVPPGTLAADGDVGEPQADETAITRTRNHAGMWRISPVPIRAMTSWTPSRD